MSEGSTTARAPSAAEAERASGLRRAREGPMELAVAGRALAGSATAQLYCEHRVSLALSRFRERVARVTVYAGPADDRRESSTVTCRMLAVVDGCIGVIAESRGDDVYAAIDGAARELAARLER